MATEEKEIKYMALSRKALAAMGIEAEKIEQIVEMNSDSVAGLKDRITELEESLKNAEKYQKDAEKLREVQKELDELKKQVEADAKEREGKDYEKLKQEFDAYKQEQERKEVRSAKESAYTEILKDAGIAEKHWAKIVKYSDVDSIELDEKGKAKDSKNILKAIKEEWSDHISQTNVQGGDVNTPPANTGGAKTAEEIMKIENKAERRKAMIENHELFGL